MYTSFDTLLLTRLGRIVLPAAPSVAGAARPELPEAWLQALDVDLCSLGFAIGHRARAAIGSLDAEQRVALHQALVLRLAASVGGGERHEPLFRRFPYVVPADTHELWLKKFVGFYLQNDDQPCLWCDGIGHTHILSPCGHVVCDHCFDGSTYSACPVCERHVDRDSSFFLPPPPQTSWEQLLTRLGGIVGSSDKPLAASGPLRRLDLAGPRQVEAQALFTSLVQRPQAMSPDDVAALLVVVQAFGAEVLAWLPPKVPVRENVAHIFGTLLKGLPPAQVFGAAGPWLKTATDLLRVIAVWSGAEASLPAWTKRVPVVENERARWARAPKQAEQEIRFHRFKVGKMDRALRRALLAWLNELAEPALFEDVCRHRSAWVGVGEVLHPGEYRKRWPRAAMAFQVARGAVPFSGFAAVAESLRGESEALADHLASRPGELWRRADVALRNARNPAPVLAALLAAAPKVSLPTLLTMSAHFRHRHERLPARVYFPKGAQFLAPSTPDKRPRLAGELTSPLVRAIDTELLARFAQLPRFERAVVDIELVDVVVPFNERTAARAAVVLPRGSNLFLGAAGPSDRLRLFLHWCEPDNSPSTDLDLSIAFYDKNWAYTGVCSYYELNLDPCAVHSGDLRDAPPPAGATEFVDLDRSAALASGHRYAVMVVNAFSGLPFSSLARGFAGVMKRNREEGLGTQPHFDPATVALKFDITGPSGMYVPLLVDLQTDRLWWMDVSGKGQLALNNVATSNAAIVKICPELLAYFGHGLRPSMFDLASLHAVARADEVFVRWGEGAATQRFRPRAGESALSFLGRLRAAADPDGMEDINVGETPVFAALLHGDVAMPAGSVAWALFREKLTDSLAASDLLNVPAARP